MRLLALTLMLAPAIALAEPPTNEAGTTKYVVGEGRDGEERGEPLWEAELRLGYGVMSRGTEMGSDVGASPLSIEASGLIAVNDDPHVMAYAGLVGEMVERSSVGVTAGARVKVPGVPLRVGGGGTWMYAPSTLWGAQASIGSCVGQGSVGLCGDVQMTAFVAGTGLPADETELQVQFVLGVVVRGARR